MSPAPGTLPVLRSREVLGKGCYGQVVMGELVGTQIAHHKQHIISIAPTHYYYYYYCYYY